MDSDRLTAVLRGWGLRADLAALLVSRLGRFYSQVLQRDSSTELGIRFLAAPDSMGHRPTLVLALESTAEHRESFSKWFAEYFDDLAIRGDVQVQLRLQDESTPVEVQAAASAVLSPSSFQGKILDVNSSGFGTIEGFQNQHRKLFFSFDRIYGYKGQSARELGLHPGARVEVTSTSTGEVASVKIIPS